MKETQDAHLNKAAKATPMTIEIEVDRSPESDIKNLVFDSRDYFGHEVQRSTIEEEMAALIRTDLQFSGYLPVFILHNAVGMLSISELFKAAVSVSKAASVDKIKIVVRSETVKNHLDERLPLSEPMRQEFNAEGHRVIIVTGDITEVAVDTIVNASNTRMVLGAGVSGAISAKAGNSLQTEMLAIARSRAIRPGDALVTGSHSLTTCRRIIHAATAEGSPETVRHAVRNCLAKCVEQKIESIAFPALGTGTGGLASAACAEAMIGELLIFFQNQPPGCLPKTVVIVLSTKGAFTAFSAWMGAELHRSRDS